MPIGSEGFLMEPGVGLMLWTAFALFVATPAAIVTGLKGQWLWLVLGFPTGGIGWIWGAIQAPKPGSIWAHRRTRSSSHH
jgi:hypothetical protein